jgi:hypothetical protein
MEAQEFRALAIERLTEIEKTLKLILSSVRQPLVIEQRQPPLFPANTSPSKAGHRPPERR